ncbi:MAG: YbjN domain-containing protein [Bifidobacteriaceae bacterium]|nr:YbjN domain-containing protein [Bifidobacteriaceae bacterium]
MESISGSEPEDIPSDASELFSIRQPPALTQERLKEALQAEGWVYHIDADGDIGGLWDSNVFYFFCYGKQGEILQIRGRWSQHLPIELRNSVRAVLDNWHFTKIWPKAYTRVDDKGRMWVLAEHTVDWEYGVTDEQLRLTLRCSITASVSLFRHLHKRFITVGEKPDDLTTPW